MGGGEMGKLEPNQKYVVVVEVYGPKGVDQGKEFDQALADLMKRFGGKMVYWAHASKREGDDRRPTR